MSLIDVVVAVRNEEKYIKKCIKSLQEQTIRDIKIIIVDGMSSDKTRQIIKEMMKRDKRIRMLLNKKKIVSAGRNIGFKYSKAEFIAYIDGHSFAEKNWLETLYRTFLKFEKRYKLAGVGSTHLSPSDDSFFSKVMDSCFKTLFGGIGSSYMKSDKIEKVETAAFVLYKKSVIEREKITYDESMTHCEDTDFNYRLIKKGYTILKDPNAIVYYYKRKNLKDFFHQMISYGLGRYKFIRKHPETLRIYYVLPSIFVIYSMVFVISIALNYFKFITNKTLLLVSVPFILYTTLNICETVKIVIKHRRLKALISFLIFPAEHFGYGLGFLKGLIGGKDGTNG